MMEASEKPLQPLSERPSAPTGATLRGKDSSSSIEHKLSQGKATEAVARAAGLSTRTFQRIEMARPLLEIERELARRRLEATLPKKGEQGFRAPQKFWGAREGRGAGALRQEGGLQPRDGEAGALAHG
jgi:hypothetical protein